MAVPPPHRWSEGHLVEVSGSLVDLLGATIDALVVTEPTGHLAITSQDGRRIDDDADDRYEAWNSRGVDGFHVICTAGGELRIFDPVTPPSTG